MYLLFTESTHESPLHYPTISSINTTTITTTISSTTNPTINLLLGNTCSKIIINIDNTYGKTIENNITNY